MFFDLVLHLKIKKGIFGMLNKAHDCGVVKTLWISNVSLVIVFVLLITAFSSSNVYSHSSWPVSYSQGVGYHVHGGAIPQQGSCSGTFFLDNATLILNSFQAIPGDRYYCYFRHVDCSGEDVDLCIPPAPPEGPLASSINNGNDDCPSNYTSNPINIATGSKYFYQHYFRGQGINPLRFALYYNTNTTGKPWTHSYTQSLEVSSNSIEAKRPDGQVLRFANNQGYIVGLPGRTEKLLKVSNSENNSQLVTVYRLTLKDKTVESYNEEGKLLLVKYPSGISHKVLYSVSPTSGMDRIYVSRMDDDGVFSETLRLSLSDENITFASYRGDSMYFEYDTVNDVDRLLRVTYKDDSSRIYLYENTIYPHFITGIIDESGNRTSSVEYDAQGRAISSEVGVPNSGIERTEIEYHADGSRTLTNSLGKQATYHFTQFNGEYKMTQVEGHPSANCASANQAYTYDANGFMASKTDWKGNVTTYINNDRGLEVSRTEASGTSEARITLTEWHPNFNLRTKITEPERETVFTYDIKGRLTSQEVSPR